MNVSEVCPVGEVDGNGIAEGPGKSPGRQAMLVVALRALLLAPGARARMLRPIKQFLFSSQPGSSAQRCEINTLDEYEAQHRALAVMLDRPHKIDSDPDIGELRSLMACDRSPDGSLSWPDCLFLTAFTSIIAPARLIEIGTLSGFSAGIMAAAVRRQRRTESVVVETIDLRTHCLKDENRPVGFAIAQIFPQHAAAVRVHAPHDSRHVAHLAARDELELAFIDASHRHPNPLLDLLRVAVRVRPRGWILLHDIRLGSLGAEMRAAGAELPYSTPFGAEWVFARWPFRKISGGNIGAVQLPDDKMAIVPFALEMLTLPSELKQRQSDAAAAAVYAALADLA